LEVGRSLGRDYDLGRHGLVSGIMWRCTRRTIEKTTVYPFRYDVKVLLKFVFEVGVVSLLLLVHLAQQVHLVVER